MADFWSVLSKALDLSFEKFIIFLVFVILVFVMKSFIKTILSQSKISDTRNENMRRAFEDHTKKLNEFQSAFQDMLHRAKGEMLQAKFDFMKEVQDLKTLTVDLNAKINKVEGKLSMVPPLEEAVKSYNNRIDYLEKNFKVFIDVLKKKQEKGGL